MAYRVYESGDGLLVSETRLTGRLVNELGADRGREMAHVPEGFRWLSESERKAGLGLSVTAFDGYIESMLRSFDPLSASLGKPFRVCRP